MHRLLVVDDEPDIADGLCAVLRNTEHLELDVYKAYSGTEALQLLDRTRIDIVLSDIRMPGMSGLQLVEKISQNWPLCKVIFITGYNEFEYVYNAVKYDGISGYLLKTEGYEEIIKAVEKAAHQIDHGARKDELIRKGEQAMRAALPVMQKEYLTDMVHGEAEDAIRTRRERFEELEIPLDAERPVLLLLGRLDSFPNAGSLERSRLFLSIKFVAEQYLPSVVARFSVQTGRNELLWIMQPATRDAPASASDAERMPYLVKGCVETVQMICKESLNAPMSFVIDREFAAWEEISEKYEALRRKQHVNIGPCMSMIYMGQSNDSNVSTERISRLLKKIDTLNMYLESGQRADFFALYVEFVAGLQGCRVGNDCVGLEIFQSLSLMILSHMNRWNLEDMAVKIDIDRLARMEEHASWNEILSFFKTTAETVFELQNSGGERKAVFAVNQIKQYVHEHLAEDLSLAHLGELVHFNPSYLSRLFKQVTGVNLLTYINEARLKHAKTLLQNNELKINEIASAVGYESSSYFTHFFKKKINMSPQEYRETYFTTSK